jgi:hypothetical protein
MLRQPIVGLGLAGALLVAAAFAAPGVLSDQDPADAVTRQTARVAVLFWGLAAVALLLGRREFGRAAWIVGAGTLIIHVVTAFDRVHGWKHAAAYRHVEAVSGFGPGIFVSYAFTVIWADDALWWWIDRRTYESRIASLDRAIHCFIAFVVFNATVVYETGLIRWVGGVLFLVLGILLIRRILVRVEGGP